MSSRKPLPIPHPLRSQRGVVLIIALIMLVIISLLAAMSVRTATSSEGVNSNVRQTQLATQSAETALRYCEDALLNLVSGGTATYVFTAPPATTTSTLALTHIKDYVAGTPASVVTSNWDTTTAGPLVLPASSVNLGGVSATFSRPPECMMERMNASTSALYTSSFTVTARGFGPEVSAADSSRTRPTGSEVWLQSTLDLQ